MNAVFTPAVSNPVWSVVKLVHHCTNLIFVCLSMSDVRAGGHRSRLGLKAWVGFSIAFRNVGKVAYDGDDVIESAWTTTVYS